MRSLTSKFKQLPEGADALFFIQFVSTSGFAILYCTLVLHTTRHLGFSAKQATAIMGVFGAFNYGLHLFAGYLGGHFLSHPNLFIGGMVLQVFGCVLIAAGTTPSLYWGLALFLTGSGLNFTYLKRRHAADLAGNRKPVRRERYVLGGAGERNPDRRNPASSIPIFPTGPASTTGTKSRHAHLVRY